MMRQTLLLISMALSPDTQASSDACAYVSAYRTSGHMSEHHDVNICSHQGTRQI